MIFLFLFEWRIKFSLSLLALICLHALIYFIPIAKNRQIRYTIYVSFFRYLGHIISDRLCDNDDIQREIKNTFIRTNTLICKFNRCSFDVKCALFRSYCLSLYDVALWQNYTLTCINKFRSCYNKCIKSLFGYSRRYSLT